MIWALFSLSDVCADEAQPRPRIILLTAAQQIVDSEEDLILIESQLEDLPVRFEVIRQQNRGPDSTGSDELAHKLANEDGVLAVVWLDGVNSNSIHFLLEGENGIRLFNRDLGENRAAAVQKESLALILRATVQALIEEQPSAPPSAQPPSPVADSQKVAIAETIGGEHRRSSAEESAKPSLVGVETAYAYRAYDESFPALSGFHMGVHVNLWAMLQLFVEYELRQSMQSSGSCVETTFRSHPISTGGRLFWRLKRLALGPYLTATVDVLRAETKSTCRQVNVDSKIAHAHVSLALGFFVDFRIHERLGLFLMGEGDLLIHGQRYVGPKEDGEKEVLLEPWRVQPALTVGLSIALL